MQRYRVPQREMDRRGGDRSEPLHTPAMAGGLFAIDRDYFYEVILPENISRLYIWQVTKSGWVLRRGDGHLGRWEPGNELQSLAVWWHPWDHPMLSCWSRLQVELSSTALLAMSAWIFRDKSPYTFPGGVAKIVNKNAARVAEVIIRSGCFDYSWDHFAGVDGRVARLLLQHESWSTKCWYWGSHSKENSEGGPQV